MINAVKVQSLIKNFTVDFAGDVDDVRFSTFELFADCREFESFTHIFLNVVFTFKHGENLIFKIIVVAAFTGRRED